MQVINHVEMRAARSSPGHGIRMQTCSNLARTSHDITEGGRANSWTGSAVEGEGGLGMDTQIITVSPILLVLGGGEQSRPASWSPIRARISIVHGLEQRRGRMGDPDGVPPGLLFSDRADMVRSNRRGGVVTTNSKMLSPPIDLDGTRG